MKLVRTVRCAALGTPLLAIALALSSPARAQGEAPPQEEMGMGLDLTEATMDLRPTLAVVGVDLTEGEPKRDGWVLNYIGTMLTTNATKSNLFVSVMKPEDVAQKLGAKHAEALKCAEDACMVEIASTLGVERVITAQASHGATTSGLKLNAFTRATLAVQSATVEVKGPPRGDFFKKTVVATRPLLQALSGKLARLKVEPTLDTAKVTLGDRELGTGTVDVKVSAGTYLLKATAEGYAAQQQVALEEGGSATLPLSLEPVREPASTPVASAGGGKSPPSPPGPGGPPEEGPLSARPPPAGSRGGGAPLTLDGFLKHPGTYVGAAGAVALLVGSGVGATAMATQGRARDSNGDGVLEVTRNDALAARTQAVVANVLFAAGAVGLAGGGAWLFVSPPKGGGVAVSAGGKF